MCTIGRKICFRAVPPKKYHKRSERLCRTSRSMLRRTLFHARDSFVSDKDSKNKNRSGSRDHFGAAKKGRKIVKSEHWASKISSRLMNGVVLKLMLYPVIFSTLFFLSPRRVRGTKEIISVFICLQWKRNMRMKARGGEEKYLKKKLHFKYSRGEVHEY